MTGVICHVIVGFRTNAWGQQTFERIFEYTQHDRGEDVYNNRLIPAIKYNNGKHTNLMYLGFDDEKKLVLALHVEFKEETIRTPFIRFPK